LLGWLNARVCDELERLPDVVIPFSLCAVDLARYRLRFCNAGHIPAHILRGGAVSLVKANGPALGFVKDVEYTSTEIGIEPGDRVVLFTDGLYRGAVGRKAVDEAILTVPDDATYADALIDRVREATPNRRFDDDATVVSVRIS
jgi:serine phosphatase RsbU (regulator of sigma subunit)